MNCTKCIHFEMCKYIDCLPKIQETFPFVEDISCKYMEKGEKKVREPKKSTSTKTVEEKAPETEPEPVESEDASTEEPSGVDDDDDKTKTFGALGVDKLFGEESDVTKALIKLGCVTVSDIYTINKKNLSAKLVNNINMKLQIFNQPII